MNNKICPICGKTIIKPSGNRQIYCSPQCARKGNQNLDRIKSRNKTRNSRMIINAVYHSECAICGWRAANILTIDRRGKVDWQSGCEIHHILPVAEGGEDDWDNLILLCPNHHKQANLGLIKPNTLREYQRTITGDFQKEIGWIESVIKEYKNSNHQGKFSIKLSVAMDFISILYQAGVLREYYDELEGRMVLAEDLSCAWEEIKKENFRAGDDIYFTFSPQKDTYFERVLHYDKL